MIEDFYVPHTTEVQNSIKFYSIESLHTLKLATIYARCMRIPNLLMFMIALTIANPHEMSEILALASVLV
jgi:hypothetical protein